MIVSTSEYHGDPDVLVIPRRPVARLSDLSSHELACLMNSVQAVGRAVERAYDADGLTVACQDGKAAGQSVPHVHFHLLPRKFKGDRFSGEKNDDVYPALEKSEEELGNAVQMKGEPLRVDDEGRQPRTMEDMEKEAKWLQDYINE